MGRGPSPYSCSRPSVEPRFPCSLSVLLEVKFSFPSAAPPMRQQLPASVTGSGNLHTAHRLTTISLGNVVLDHVATRPSQALLAQPLHTCCTPAHLTRAAHPGLNIGIQARLSEYSAALCTGADVGGEAGQPEGPGNPVSPGRSALGGGGWTELLAQVGWSREGLSEVTSELKPEG